MPKASIKYAAIILARLDSSRFPRKALTKIGGKRLVEWSIDRFMDHPWITPILATSDRSVDDELAEFAKEKGIRVFRGRIDDVAHRVVGCIEAFDIEYFARINGDSVFFPIQQLETAFESVDQEDYDFVTNLVPRSFPYGISVEVFRSSIFTETYARLQKNEEKEHITKYFYEHLAQFRVKKIVLAEGDYSHILLTIDQPEDQSRLETLLKNINDENLGSVMHVIEAYENTNNT